MAAHLPDLRLNFKKNFRPGETVASIWLHPVVRMANLRSKRFFITRHRK
jgi:hypothetical protein